MQGGLLNKLWYTEKRYLKEMFTRRCIYSFKSNFFSLNEINNCSHGKALEKYMSSYLKNSLHQ